MVRVVPLFPAWQAEVEGRTLKRVALLEERRAETDRRRELAKKVPVVSKRIPLNFH